MKSRPPSPRPRPNPRALLAASAALGLAAVLLWHATPGRQPTPPAERRGLVLDPVTFAALPGWATDDQASALRAFVRSCPRFSARGLGRAAAAARPALADVDAWAEACRAAKRLAGAGPEAARAFFERRFRPFVVRDAAGGDAGLFTGYYEPELRGSLARHGRYAVPLYRKPDDLVTFRLDDFGADLPRRRLAGRVADGRLVPYPDRAAIDAGALAGRGLEILWLDDPVDAFFLHIQGSGRVRLEDGRVVRVGYAGQNGRPYRAIGRDLVAMGAVPRDAVSLQTIRAWLNAHPARAPEVMHRNPSYVFFENRPDLADDDGPAGAMNVPLTPGRSLAVDPDSLPLGAPVWLDAAPPAPGRPPLRRLVVAQDTGGAITGAVRGDLFWGAGAEAEALAGGMRSRGRYAVLVPRPAARAALPSGPAAGDG